MSIPVATQVWSLFGGCVVVQGFGSAGDTNWSMKKVEEYFFDSESLHAMVFRSGVHGTKTFWSPTPSTCTGVVARRDDPAWHRKFAADWTELWRGPQADGTIINPGEGYAVSPADCPTVFVLTEDGRLVCCHAGRDSILDTAAFKEKREPGPRVAHAIAEAVGDASARRAARVHIGFSGISAGPHFAHDPESAKYPHNRAMVEWVFDAFGCNGFAHRNGAVEGGWLDLTSILWHQLVDLGFEPARVLIDTTCTYTDREPSGTHRWYSNARSDTHRNLIVAHFVK